MLDTRAHPPVMIVGGGLSGLSAAAILARAGYAVAVFEKASVPGGDARSKQQGAFTFNLGAHAFYLGGAGEQLLSELGVRYCGAPPALDKWLVRDRGKLHAWPTRATSLTGMPRWHPEATAALARFSRSVKGLPQEHLQHVSLRDWLDQEVPHPQVRQFVLALARLTTLSHAPALVPAGLILPLLSAQALYLDGGWQTLVDGLKQVAQEAGAKLIMHARVAAIESAEERHTVRLANGASYPASAVVLAIDPQAASALVAEGAHKDLSGWARQSVPARAACLDVALRRLPEPQHLFALGIDRPLYAAVHSAWAKLAPEGSALVHTLKNLQPDEPAEPLATRQELEALLDSMQPGWRAEVVEQSFLPQMVPSHAMVLARQGGLPGRPGPAVPGIRHLYVAGDWVGTEGQLADACFASARSAARMIMSTLAAKPGDAAVVH
ncbi:MAG TPA: NAD(P)/FAD-dependent oxidoreductase [Ktedonobacterales bacterium]|nr:NAD(P)/FAD-dependent oxidoreductase [Ktedonobacterales bacterium]